VSLRDRIVARSRSSYQLINAFLSRKEDVPLSTPVIIHVAHYDPSCDMNGAKLRLQEFANVCRSLGMHVLHARTTDWSIFEISESGCFVQTEMDRRTLKNLYDVRAVMIPWSWTFKHHDKILHQLGFLTEKPRLIYDTIDFISRRLSREYISTLLQDSNMQASPEEERACAEKADITICVSNEEVCDFGRLGARGLLRLGFAPSNLPKATRKPQSDGFFAGFFGSKNTANLYTLVRSANIAYMDSSITKFIVAGGVCGYTSEIDFLKKIFGQWIVILGEVDSIDEFYNEIDVSFNIFSFGSGIKIKNVESLSFGCPVITNDIGAEGIDLKPEDGFFVCNTLSEYRDAISFVMKSRHSGGVDTIRGANALKDLFASDVKNLVQIL